ncbi:tachylectin-related carbohydrate-binding protein [Glaciihabitans sp. dw_435]|uniref:tachylectin-related carbohydrate-binding protein n=1 Tax=Glaciihabitans sp. dw_435 TaxID=2720081 RepID=UPI001BD3B345|nr:tachylectin-related carbohydrate-binding protein [Glaciihabitans sp. dw_435]
MPDNILLLHPQIPLEAETHRGVPVFRSPAIDLRVVDPDRPAVADLSEQTATVLRSALAEYIDLTPIRLGKRVDRRPWQSNFLTSQGSRGSCWAFAGIAALEAAYARQGVRVKLSEQYAFHLSKAWANQHDGGGVHSLIGFQGSADIVHHLSFYGVPEARLVPYTDQGALQSLANSIPQTGGALSATPGSGTLDQADWFEFDLRHVPLAGRWSAAYRVAKYGSVDATVENIKKILELGYEVVVDVEDIINNGGHVILIYGYDDTFGTFMIKNSQSLPGFETMKYQNDPHFLLRNSQAYYITAVAPIVPQTAAAWVGRWAIDHDGWRGRLVIRSFIDLLGSGSLPTENSQIGLGTWFGEDGRVLPVTGWFVDEARGLNCYIGDQRFELYLHGADPYFASGQCWWNGIPFGVTLSRGVTTGAGSGPFQRSQSIGTWEMDHDGWRGTLRIGTDSWYRQAADGALKRAWIDPASITHKVDAHVDFGPTNTDQHFELLVHTRERGVFGGVTHWGGRSWPAAGRLAANLYTIRTDGTLTWYQHTGRDALNYVWEEPKKVGTGWQHFSKVIGGRDGVIYALKSDGTLHWYFHRGRNQGTFDWEGPLQVGTGWSGFTDIVAGDGGVIYGLRPDGTLHWYRHRGRRNGTFEWDGPFEVGSGWNGFVRIVAGPEGTVYGVQPSGDLLWYRHMGFDHGFPIWQGPRKVGTGWGTFDKLLATGAGYIYGRVSAGNPNAGDLMLYRHTGFETGEFAWRDGQKVGNGWTTDVVDVFAT